MPARLQTCKADYLFGTVLPASGNNERVNAGKAVGCIAAKPKQCDKKKNSERTENVTPVLSPPLFLVADAACGVLLNISRYTEPRKSRGESYGKHKKQKQRQQ